MLRTQADFHSAFVMCVPRSQKPMQSASVLPPPPGLLGAVSLGLPGEVPGVRARLGRATLEVANCSGNCGESGAIGASSGNGSPIADGGVAAMTGAGGAALITALELIVCASNDALAALTFANGDCAGCAGAAGIAVAGCDAFEVDGGANTRGIVVGRWASGTGE
jgi:hypothetical protein